MIFLHKAIFELYPEVLATEGNDLDNLTLTTKDGNNIELNKTKIEAKIKELELQDEKNKKLQELNKVYETALQEDIEYKGHIFDAYFKSQDVLTKVITTAPDGFTTVWIDKENNAVELTLAELKEMAGLILQRGQELFKKKFAIKEQIKNCNSIDCLEQIKIELGGK